VPHSPQKRRTTRSEDEKDFNVPFVKRVMPPDKRVHADTKWNHTKVEHPVVSAQLFR
jgi:hypothetical protein